MVEKQRPTLENVVIPKMTADVMSFGKASVSSNFSASRFSAYNVFAYNSYYFTGKEIGDPDLWVSDVAGTQWIRYDSFESNPLIFSGYYLEVPRYKEGEDGHWVTGVRPTSWDFQISNDNGNTWQTIHSVTDYNVSKWIELDSGMYSHYFGMNITCKSFRILLKTNNGPYYYIFEFGIFRHSLPTFSASKKSVEALDKISISGVEVNDEGNELDFTITCGETSGTRRYTVDESKNLELDISDFLTEPGILNLQIEATNTIGKIGSEILDCVILNRGDGKFYYPNSIASLKELAVDNKSNKAYFSSIETGNVKYLMFDFDSEAYTPIEKGTIGTKNNKIKIIAIFDEGSSIDAMCVSAKSDIPILPIVLI